MMCDALQTQLGSSPVPPFGVVPDFITSFHLNPLGNGVILLLFLGQELIDSESHGRRHGEKQPAIQSRMGGEKEESFLIKVQNLSSLGRLQEGKQ